MPFGGPNHEMRGWSRHKLSYLQSYIRQYRLATSSAWRTFYIDGSPLIALKTKPPFSKCYLIELDAGVTGQLRSAASPYRNAEVVVGDANEEVPRILSFIHEKSPTLVVLDPTGVIGQVKWSTIEAISKKRTEIFVNFPYHMAVQRLLPNDQDLMTDMRARELSPYLPPGWLDVYADCANLGRKTLCRRFLELYRDSLRGLGFSYVFASSALRTDTGIPLYYLIWAGKNKKGATIAEHVILKQFSPQTIRLLSADDDNWIA